MAFDGDRYGSMILNIRMRTVYFSSQYHMIMHPLIFTYSHARRLTLINHLRTDLLV